MTKETTALKQMVSIGTSNGLPHSTDSGKRFCCAYSGQPFDYRKNNRFIGDSYVVSAS